jgi:Tesmin/TSO1-like CXC domain, cysteine-rich domain
MAESVSSKNHDSESGSVDSDIPLEAAHEYRSSVMASASQMQQQEQELQHHAPLHSHAPLYHHYPPPPPPPPTAYGSAGPYSAAVGNPSRSGPYPPPPPPHISSQQHLHSQGFQGPHGPTSHLPPSHHHEYHRPIPLRAHEAEYLGHHPPPANTYASQIPIYGAPPDERRWMGPEGQPPHMYSGYEQPRYNKPLSSQSFPPPPPVQPTSHVPYGYPHNVYPPTANNRLEENSRIDIHEPGPDSAEVEASEVDSRDHGATSPSQISSAHRDEVSNMGCTCKKTKCLKLYCQCFAVKVRNETFVQHDRPETKQSMDETNPCTCTIDCSSADILWVQLPVPCLLQHGKAREAEEGCHAYDFVQKPNSIRYQILKNKGTQNERAAVRLGTQAWVQMPEKCMYEEGKLPASPWS